MLIQFPMLKFVQFDSPRGSFCHWCHILVCSHNPLFSANHIAHLMDDTTTVFRSLIRKKNCYNNFQVEKCTVHQIPQWIRNCFTIFSNQIYVVLTLLVYLKYGFLKKCTFDLCQLTISSHHFLASDVWKLSTHKGAFIIR